MSEVSDCGTAMRAPTEEGQYWAKLVHPTRMPAGEDWASSEWEIVRVCDNNGTGDETFYVSVQGIEPGQWIPDFIWGPRVPDLPSEDLMTDTPDYASGQLDVVRGERPTLEQKMIADLRAENARLREEVLREVSTRLYCLSVGSDGQAAVAYSVARQEVDAMREGE